MRRAFTGLQEHLITGEDVPLERTTPLSDVMTQYNYMGEVNYPNPMDPGTAGVGPGMFEGNPLGTIQSGDAMQSNGLASAAGPTGDMVDMNSANENSGGANGGPSADAYGPRFTGRS